MRFAVVFGTRPEAIKMAPLVIASEARSDIDIDVVVTGQHKEMLQQVLSIFSITPAINLQVMVKNQSLASLTARCLEGLDAVFRERRYDGIFVHGDTTTTMAASVAAFYNKIPVFHVEAGLRTGNKLSPWPEEMNRVLTGRLADLHFAPTDVGKRNLIGEGTDTSRVFVVGNTVIDSLRWASEAISSCDLSLDLISLLAKLDPKKRMILVTGHRRENLGGGFEEICNALVNIAQRSDVEIVYPVHLNPKVKDVVYEKLSQTGNIFCTPPFSYLDFIKLMQRCYLVLTDSGGIQEEAPYFRKPVLVMRDTTERPEGVDAGTAKLVGADASSICSELSKLLEDNQAYRAMALATNPYGDGFSSDRIINHAVQYLSRERSNTDF